MNLFDIFENREPYQQAIDKLEQRRIEDLEIKMDDLSQRAKESTDPKVKEVLRHEFAKAKAERDSYHTIKEEEVEEGDLLRAAWEKSKQTMPPGHKPGWALDPKTKLELKRREQSRNRIIGVDEVLDTNYTYTVFIDGTKEGTYGSKEEAKAVVARKKQQAPGRDYTIKPKSRTSAASIKRFNKNRDRTDEGWQDFNKVEPYAVCLAGKPVKKFDYYEEARRFHDNWKQKLYREGDMAKAEKITLMPLNLDEAGSPAQQAAIAIAKKKEQGVTEDTGSWIVYDPATKQIKKRFRTHTAGKSYAQTHKLGFASSEYYFDTIKQPEVEEGSMASAAHHSSGAKFGGYYKGTQKGAPRPGQSFGGMEESENPMGAKELEYLMAKARNTPATPFPELHTGEEHEINGDDQKVGEGIQGNMTVKSAPITHPLRQRNFVAKNAIQSGAGKHANQLKKAAAAGRHAKHKGQPLDISESDNFLTWAIKSGYNFTSSPAVYESAKKAYKALQEDKGPVAPHETYYGALDESLKPDEYFVWTVYFDDGSKKRVKVTSDEFDPYEYYAKKNKVVVDVDYDWSIHSTTSVEEDISPRELNYIEQVADSFWKHLGIDVEFTRHFLDRVNDERNGEPITAEELIDLFKKEYERYGEIIKSMKQPDALMIDLISKINIPFIVKQKDKKHKELVAATVMRTPNFKSPPNQRKFTVK